MNVPKEYDDDVECLIIHPLLLPKEDVPGIMTAADKVILKKTNDKIYFAPDVSFVQQTSLTPQIPRIKKIQGTRKKSMPQRVTHQIAPPQVHRKSMLGDRDNWYA